MKNAEKIKSYFDQKSRSYQSKSSSFPWSMIRKYEKKLILYFLGKATASSRPAWATEAVVCLRWQSLMPNAEHHQLRVIQVGLKRWTSFLYYPGSCSAGHFSIILIWLSLILSMSFFRKEAQRSNRKWLLLGLT